MPSEHPPNPPSLPTGEAAPRRAFAQLGWGWKVLPLVLFSGLAIAIWLLVPQVSPLPWVRAKAPSAEPIPLPSPPAEPFANLPASLLEALDGSSQVVLPPGWKEEADLNPVAQIQAANREQQMYLVVRAQPRAELENLSFAAFAERSRQQLTAQLSAVETQGPSETVTQVGEFPATQYEIRGTLNNIGVVYLHTTAETPEHFTQILTWTSPTDFARNEAEMQRLIQSVELK